MCRRRHQFFFLFHLRNLLPLINFCVNFFRKSEQSCESNCGKCLWASPAFCRRFRKSINEHAMNWLHLFILFDSSLQSIFFFFCGGKIDLHLAFLFQKMCLKVALETNIKMLNIPIADIDSISMIQIHIWCCEMYPFYNVYLPLRLFKLCDFAFNSFQHISPTKLNNDYKWWVCLQKFVCIEETRNQKVSSFQSKINNIFVSSIQWIKDNSPKWDWIFRFFFFSLFNAIDIGLTMRPF